MHFFCGGCNNLLKKGFGEWVKINGKILFKCVCGHLNELPAKYIPGDLLASNNAKPLGTTNGVFYLFITTLLCYN
jgi:hypothetical protein